MSKFKAWIRAFPNLDWQSQAYYLALLGWFLCLLIYRLHNSWSFNPYWGYDGGGHVDYLLSLAQHNRMPSIDTNYIAWHEPLYYLIYAGVAKLFLFFRPDLSYLFLLKMFGVLQAFLSVAVCVLAWRLISLFTKSRPAILATVFLVSLLPPMNQASTFLTNELLNIFFVFLVSWFFLKHFVLSKKTDWRYFAGFGVIAGLALVTKITAAVPLAVAFLVWAIDIIRRRDKKLLVRVLLALLIVVIIELPWQIYRGSNVLGGFSINNTKFVTPAPLVLDARVGFYDWFDHDIFKFPYWTAGGRSFWSMLYADSFYDYYGTVQNQDLINHLAQVNRAALVRTTIKPNYVRHFDFRLTSILIWLSLPMFALLLLGLVRQFVEFFRARFFSRHAYALGVTWGLLAAAVYFSYRYPYPDLGTIKSIFIAPAYLFGYVYGLEYLAHKSVWLFRLAALVTFIYLVLIAANYWIPTYGY